jgi:ribosome-associated protein
MNNLLLNNILQEDLVAEIKFKATRSSGKGGQNVNKVSTKVILIFDIEKSTALNSYIKTILKRKLKNKITLKGELKVSVSKERSQAMNRKVAMKRFLEIIDNALIIDKVRIPTQPLKSANDKRLAKKAVRSSLKEYRTRKIDIEE